MSAGKLPEGWLKAQLEDIVEILDSMRIPVNNKERQERIEGKDFNKLYPYYGATGEVGKIDDFIFDEELIALGEDGVPFFDGQKNKAYMLYGKTWVNNHAHVLKAIQGLSHNKFLCYFLNQFDYHDYVNGGTRLKLTQANMRKIPVHFAPFSEQKIIAEKLDKLLTQVDSTKARLEQIPQILKRFRQAVLVSAVNGKFQAESSSKECCTIDSLCLTSFDGPFGSKLKTSDYTNSGVRVVRLENIGHLEFNSEKETYISHEKYKSLYSNTLKENDLIFSSFVDEDVRVCLIPQSEEIFINKADCFCLRVDPSLASPYYLALVLASKTSYEQIKEKVQGITRPRINLRTLRSLKFDIPDLKEQHEIVRRVEQLFAYADTIEKQVNSALTRVNSLTQSILAKAFRGELTAQWRAENPDLISGENSAAALLEKIKAERAASGGKKTSRKKS
ncbi:type I restriction endonuclease StySJI subunit S [Salmonella enterica]|uniref:Type I restriction endonuclease StySJI subunit S n=1 Tax=Salmonella enterica TaxID=28901 RepID=A0A379QBJ1_SALER|nr:restriction endonuclease subunit S [Salmonella enterica subsp. salamae serovar Springs]EBX9240723.1 restriction endonuclease subunit S [Salmonella enterica subsp. salamae serovar Springs]SUF39463.1 type I restriction endonuclease StySJI subunit S [Salmonella enterica]HCM1984878.1 restriction endonuclease subunit S [Salmonella enterica subsp. salamae serovar 40:a:z39]HCM1987860.1 restriction endonuclease subunit S [Salmonella enterica subsp. salamae serovar 40:a:z39]